MLTFRSARNRACPEYLMKGDKADQYGDVEIRRRMERGLRRALSTPPQPHGKNPKSPPPPKPKERPASKGRVHKAKTRRFVRADELRQEEDEVAAGLALGEIKPSNTGDFTAQ